MPAAVDVDPAIWRFEPGMLFSLISDASITAHLGQMMNRGTWGIVGAQGLPV
jgi:hypothetical protein